MEKHQLLTRSLVLLWFIGVVTGYSELEKRDVHRIVLKNRRPRSHRSHSYHRSRPHKHYHGHHDHDFESLGKHSFEDSSKYYGSHESSYEDVPKYKVRYHKPKRSRPHYSSAEYEDSKIGGHRGEWSPLLSSANVVLHSPQHLDAKRRPPRKDSKRHHSQFRVELTTTSPFSFYDSADISDYRFNQKAMDLKQPQLVGGAPVFKTPSMYTYNNNSYQVSETHHEDQAPETEDSFQVLTPSLDFGNMQLRLPAQEKEVAVKKGEDGKGRKTPRERDRGSRAKFNY